MKILPQIIQRSFFVVKTCQPPLQIRGQKNGRLFGGNYHRPLINVGWMLQEIESDMNFLNCIFDWELYHEINKTASKTKFTDKMDTYIPKNDSDDLNPIYLLHLTATDLLVAIVKKQIDPVELARKELKNRGLDENGKWIGFREQS